MKCSKGSLVDVNTIYWKGLILVIIYTVIAPATLVITSLYIFICNHILEGKNYIAWCDLKQKKNNFEAVQLETYCILIIIYVSSNKEIFENFSYNSGV